MTNNVYGHVPGRRRFPAEWEFDGAVMLSWPHKNSDWAYILDEVTDCYVKLAHAISEFHPLVIVAPDIEIVKNALMDLDQQRIMFCQVETNDTWARDFGPLSVIEQGVNRLLDFKFNGWGLKFAACYDNLVTSKLHKVGAFRCDLENHLGFVLEGGSIDSDGNGTILTTSECLLSPNRNGQMDKNQIEIYLKSAFGAERVIWLDHGFLMGDDTDSHVDTLVRFAPNETILYVKCDDMLDPHYDDLRLMEEDLMKVKTASGLNYNLVGLPMPSPIVVDGERLPATYANFLVTKKAVFMPVYGQPQNDMLAQQILKIVFPDHPILTVDCRPLIKQHGSLHCVTMQLPDGILPI